jgi:hypothetical protein
MQFDIYRRSDGALIASPSRFDGSMLIHALPVRFVRRAWLELDLLSETFVADLGLHGFAIARGADAALLRNSTRGELVLRDVE